jgi:hypothetical protein
MHACLVLSLRETHLLRPKIVHCNNIFEERAA